jgi:hypothetical protein
VLLGVSGWIAVGTTRTQNEARSVVGRLFICAQGPGGAPVDGAGQETRAAAARNPLYDRLGRGCGVRRWFERRGRLLRPISIPISTCLVH